MLLSPFEVRGPKLNIVLKVPHQCQVQGTGHFPNPAGHTILALDLLGYLGTLLAPPSPFLPNGSQATPPAAWSCRGLLQPKCRT